MVTSATKPSADDFERAKATMRRNDRGLSEVRNAVIELFKERGLHELFLLYSPGTNSFGAYVFFSAEDQVHKAKNSGLAEEIEAVVLRELEAAGRGAADDLSVVFEFDSHEKVIREYDGNYFSRLY